MKQQSSLLGLFNDGLIDSINEEYIEQDRDIEEVELVRDGAIFQINKSWPDILERLSLVSDGISALEILYRDYKDILKRFALMQRLTEIIEDIGGEPLESINNVEEDSTNKE